MRVVSLLPSATEIIAALGALDQLVGVTHACDYPPQVTGLPRLTSTHVDGTAAPDAIDREVREATARGAPLYTVNEPLLASLRPDVIVTQALCDVCAVRETDVRAMVERLSPAPSIVTLSGTSIDGIGADIERVGVAIDAHDEAEELLLGLRARLRSLHDRLRAARAPRPRVAVLEWTDPVYSAGHWVPEMVHRAGGVEVLATAGEHSRAIALADVQAQSPELLVFAPCGYDLERATREARSVLARDEWGWARGLDVWAIDANALASRPGPRVIDGVEVLAGVMHPSVFGAPAGDRAAFVGQRAV
ncbi:MAG TPA: ABC transporter substrate-binding protein [Gemmatimonadaceae bacterium]|nr:ABC transporter substrate-binding protein [Gemmatimonadaceae bacterium]